MPNHLRGEKSPYLQQHAQNPVDWYPWSAEAFQRAESGDRPVFLSIGYATCHWCHVMAHESFEDPQIASLLNRDFVSVKVDREERPDIDSVYMAACQQMTGQGGWPLTIIMTPDKKPFFAGTYLPRTDRGGMAGLSGILKKVTDLWKNDRGILLATGDQIIPLLAPSAGESARGSAGLSLIDDGYDDLAASFDRLHGGFGGAPKFPTPARILFLLRYWKRTGSVPALRMAEQTLEAVRCGGIHDHIGGGFHRYSTDAAWRVPHFEKMLYDQALLLMAYTEAWQATKNPLWQKTADGIITYVMRDLRSPDGAFISAEDADSFGGEGAYYLWTRREFSEVLDETDATYAASLFHVKEQGNFPGSEDGRNILYLTPGNGSPEAGEKTASILNALHTARQNRPRPPRDGKILTDWNGLMIAALAQASLVFRNPAWYHAAAGAMHFILLRLQGPEGRLLHRWYDGEAAVPAFADDYASVILGLIGLYAAGFEPAWLGEAVRLNDILTGHFSDPDTGGFFTIPDDGEPLIARKMEIYDGAIPSANSLMLRNLVLLGHLTGNPVHEERASCLADAFAGTVGCAPSAYSAFLCGLDHLLGPATDVVVAGSETDPGAVKMIRVLRDRYLPSCTIHFRTPQSSPALDQTAPFTASMNLRDQKPAAYVCTGRSCSAPVMSPSDLLELLEKNGVLRGS